MYEKLILVLMLKNEVSEVFDFKTLIVLWNPTALPNRLIMSSAITPNTPRPTIIDLFIF
jgi:hypothetical protein